MQDSPAPQPGQIWRHKATGTLHTILEVGDSFGSPLDPAGTLWVRYSFPNGGEARRVLFRWNDAFSREQ